MLNISKNQINNCINCHLAKHMPIGYGKLHGTCKSNNPYEEISSDIVSPFQTENYDTQFSKSKIFIITITDRCTRFSKIKISPNCTGKEVKKSLSTWLKEFKPPKNILSDQGKGYRSKDFNQFCLENNIIHIYSSIYNPTGNSISERINQQINECMRIYKGACIKEFIRIIMNRLNNVYHTNINTTPFEKVFGKHPYNFLNTEIENTYDLCKKSINKKKYYMKRWKWKFEEGK